MNDLQIASTANAPNNAPGELRPARGIDAPEWLRDLWYLALPSRQLKPGKMLAKSILGEPVLLARGDDGQAFALRDICPHRGIPLSCGRFDGRQVECCYHGWRFDGTGTCTAIPSLVADQAIKVDRIKVRRYPIAEQHGLVWIFIGEAAQAATTPVPSVPGFAADSRPSHIERMHFPCPLDDAVVGLMDPAHGPFVHRSWWWRTKASMHEKAKRFAPSDLGFTMVRHAPSKNSFAYKLLGGAPATEIAFRLPAVRTEEITAGRHRFAGLTAITPLGKDKGCEVTQVMYWTMPWITLLRPVLRHFARTFLAQDKAIVEMQQAGLAHGPSLMLLDDGDTQAKWYYLLKKEFARARAEGRAFQNPVKEKTLRWKS
ncbi:aromatic ring-hydroxylating dioxygenase subunit alpha [Oleomonas cavernae]|uniref:Aromatic ring-hydroxylating dioxygenase subunit alpha n=1 Tax=Oleomonas cavernae TaxID=2320859 RepID=A0A418WAF1_9PROT|nr:aromatic ring-hydroxylating dioxygenase subunit alpha [Oleomonas cavernae]RJF86938.1 aromatic ring-hydroxylating dioxygenase subunit alpha [Oleomonas cavernae]